MWFLCPVRRHSGTLNPKSTPDWMVRSPQSGQQMANSATQGFSCDFDTEVNVDALTIF